MFPSRLLAIATIRSVRPFLRFSHQQPHFRRNFSITPYPQAAENPNAFITAFKNTTVFQKLADKPDALRALTQFAKLMQDQGVCHVPIMLLHCKNLIGKAGIDFASGKPPSTLQMMKLAANSEFREGAKRVVEEMQKAGVDLKSKVRFLVGC
jgi:hypothetical protein